MARLSGWLREFSHSPLNLSEDLPRPKSHTLLSSWHMRLSSLHDKAGSAAPPCGIPTPPFAWKSLASYVHFYVNATPAWASSTSRNRSLYTFSVKQTTSFVSSRPVSCLSRSSMWPVTKFVDSLLLG